jgi:hypothetical protein
MAQPNFANINQGVVLILGELPNLPACNGNALQALTGQLGITLSTAALGVQVTRVAEQLKQLEQNFQILSPLYHSFIMDS